MIVYFTVIFFFVLILIIGFSNKKNNTLSEFIYSGRKVTTPALVATLVTTWYGGINEIGIETLHNGVIVWLYFGFFYYMAALAYAYIIAPKIIQIIPVVITKPWRDDAKILVTLTPQKK